MVQQRIGDVEAEQTQRVLEAIDTDRLVDLTRELIAVPSLSGEETDGQHLVADRMRDVGLDVDTWEIDVPAMQDNPWYSAEVDREVAVGVVGSAGGSSGPRLLLDGHMDVVPTGDPADWTTPAFVPSVRDGRVYGRGACDMKGGLAAALHALEAIRAAGVRLAGAVTLASVVGEEDGGCGTLALLDRGIRADGCVIMEPTQCSVVPAVAGALSWRLRVRGRSAHGCLREEGVSAIEAFRPLHRAVLDLERRRNRRVGDPLFAWLDTPFAICGGRIAGGDWPSSEMDWLIWEGRYGVAPGEDLDAARSEFEEAVAAAAAEHAWLRDHPPTVEWWGGQFYPGRTPTDAAVVTDVLAAVTQVTGRQPLVRGMPYGCDLGLTTNVGHIPTVVFGPGDVRDAHRPDEFVPIADLVTVARTIALTALRFCGVATSP
jgi:acetylornithine deacetylase